jgi:hypothetical protein
MELTSLNTKLVLTFEGSAPAMSSLVAKDRLALRTRTPTKARRAEVASLFAGNEFVLERPWRTTKGTTTTKAMSAMCAHRGLQYWGSWE